MAEIANYIFPAILDFLRHLIVVDVFEFFFYIFIFYNVYRFICH